MAGKSKKGDQSRKKTKQRKSKSNKRTKSRKSKSQKTIKIETIKDTQGKEPNPWYQFNFWNTLFEKNHIEHKYIGPKGDIFAQLIIFKQPENDLRGYIEFYIDGPVTLNRIDKEYRTSVRRIVVGVEDRIVFKIDNSDNNMVTFIDYEPQYQRMIQEDKTGIYKKKNDKDFGVVSMDRVKDIRDIFSWLQYSSEPQYFEDILDKVEIEKGVVIKDKEKLKAVTNKEIEEEENNI